MRRNFFALAPALILVLLAAAGGSPSRSWAGADSPDGILLARLEFRDPVTNKANRAIQLTADDVLWAARMRRAGAAAPRRNR